MLSWYVEQLLESLFFFLVRICFLGLEIFFFSHLYAASPSLFTGCDFVSSGDVGLEGGDVAMLSSRLAKALY
jgi:hypothetical protein